MAKGLRIITIYEDKSRTAVCGYDLVGHITGESKKYIRDTFDAGHVTDLFDRIVALNTPFAASADMIGMWICSGYPKELISLDKVESDMDFAKAVLNNVYKDPTMFSSLKLCITRNGIFLTKCSHSADVFHLDFASSYEMFMGKHMRDLKFADKTFTTDKEAVDFIFGIDSPTEELTESEKEATEWLDDYSYVNERTKRHDLRKKLLKLSSAGIYLLSTENDWFYAPGMSEEQLRKILINAKVYEDSGIPTVSGAGKTSVFG